ncbi:MAG: flagellar hook capping FlgD N-terminal domain-containing protein [Nitratireductor sp.]
MVDAISSLTGSNASLATASKNNTVNYDAFLQLLITQIKNQDPTEPQDSGEFLAQIASFSSVEQQIQTNEALETMLTQNLLNTATDLIDKEVYTFDGQSGGKVVAVSNTQYGMVAEIENGQRILIDSTVTIRSGTEQTDGQAASDE